MRNWIHFSIYQLVWYAMLWALNTGGIILQWLPTLLFVITHFAFFSKHRLHDLKTMLLISVIGVSIDSFLLHQELMWVARYNHIGAPVWLILLWVSFSLTFPYALQYFKKHSYAAPIFGGLGFLFSYLAPSVFGIVNLTTQGKWVLAIIWAFLFPILVKKSSPKKSSS